jgi:myo-inositol-1(or 4)-monophosphatase
MPQTKLPSELVAELRSIALEAASGGARVVREHAGSALRELGTKSTPTDLVSEADRASERFITAHIAANRPDDALHGEEGAFLPGRSGISWVADPLDGTTNFVFGVPAYSVSVAACHEGWPVAGAVVDCCRDETWSAAAGQGATCNDRPCHLPKDRSTLSTALVGTGFAYRADRRAAQAAVVADIIGEVRDIRRVGSAALDLCWVAGGRYDAFFEAGLNDWDWAAGGLICQEAGGTVGTLPTGELLAAAPQLFEPLSRLLEAAHRRAGG